MNHTPQPFRAPTAAELAVPRGLGIYVLDVSERLMGKPEEAAAKAADHGLSWVALCACWQDGPGKHAAMNAADLDDYGKAFRARGVLPWIWGYPWSESEQIKLFVERMRRAADEATAVGVILDPEVGYRRKTPGSTHEPFRSKPEAMRELLERTIESLGEGLGLGFTSYGLPGSMSDFPWSVAGGYGWGSPQCYQAPLVQAREGLRQWAMHGWRDLVVSLPTFGRNTEDGSAPDGDPNLDAKLLAYCSALLERTGGAGCFWQWAGTNKQEWATIRALAELFGGGDGFVSPAASVVARAA